MPRTAFRLVSHKRLDLQMDETQVSATSLARAAGHSDHSYISRMRRGEPRARSVTPQTAKAIATMLGVPVDYLFQEVDVRTGRPVSTPESVKSPDRAVAS